MKLLFVCHGNICRSPMAQFVMAELLRQAGRQDIQTESAALHTDELGNDIHYGTRQALREHNIPFFPRKAWLLDAKRAVQYDLILAMDHANLRDLKRLLPPEEHHRIHLLLDWAPRPRDIADPWYTGNFQETYRDVLEGCQTLLENL
jgi:protein-tyrosine phosphatase